MVYLVINNGIVASLDTGTYPGLTVGLDTSKASSPTKAMLHVSTDTGKVYYCQVNGTWTLLSSPCIEKYSNHNGTVDNVFSVVTSGNATATTSATNHRMDLSTGTGAIGNARYQGNITVNPVTQDFILNFIIQNIANGTGDARICHFGAVEDPANIVAGIFILHDTDNSFKAVTATSPVTSETTAITALSNGDLVTIYGKGNKTLFYVNGVLVAAHSLDCTSNTWIPCFTVKATDVNVTVARTASIDMISYERTR